MEKVNRFIALGFILILVAPDVMAHPGWVQTGVVAYYEGVGAFKNGGEYNSGAMMNIVEKVTSASNGDIAVTVTFTEPTSGYTYTNSSSYEPNDALGEFWYDDKALQGMKTGDNVSVFIKGAGSIPFTVTKGPFKDRINGKTWDAVMLEVKDKVEVRMVFDERTGLLLHYAEVYPNQETYVDFKSISVDLSAYQTPESKTNYTQTSGGLGNLTGGGMPNLSFCGSILFILGGVSLVFIRG